METFRRQSEAISWKSRYLRGTKSKLIIEPLSLEELVVLRRKPMTTPTLKPNKVELVSSDQVLSAKGEDA